MIPWICTLLVATTYACVGHGGASGYLMVMALSGVAPEVMKPTALILNVGVAGLGLVRAVRAKAFDWNVFWPFAVASVPAAFIAAQYKLPPDAYRILLGCVLVVASVRLLVPVQALETKPPQKPVAMAVGCVVGAVSGLTGIGGGIFLSPILVICRWLDVRRTVGVAAAFIVVNSLAALVTQFSHGLRIPPEVYFFGPPALLGGVAGSLFGLKESHRKWLIPILGTALMIAAVKLLFVR